MITHILIVDDSQTDRSNLEGILKKGGYQIRTAENGREAVDSVKANKPDLVMMDVNMPVMDGFAATRELKRDAGTKDVPVVLVTSKDQKADKAWGKMLGASGYVTKPYTEVEITEVLKSL